MYISVTDIDMMETYLTLRVIIEITKTYLTLKVIAYDGDLSSAYLIFFSYL